MSQSIAKYSYKTDTGVDITISPSVVKDLLIDPKSKDRVTDQEVILFIELCRSQRLNPFLNEAYLVKYGDSAAQMITGKETFTKRAHRNPAFDGYEAGVIVQRGEGVSRREGAMFLAGEKVVGGWAKVYRKDHSRPYVAEAAAVEYNSGQSLWKTKPATMARKVALVQALREAFPDDFSGLYDPAEMGIGEDGLPDAPVIVEAVAAPVADVPPADAGAAPPAPAAPAVDTSAIGPLLDELESSFRISRQEAAAHVRDTAGVTMRQAADSQEAADRAIGALQGLIVQLSGQDGAPEPFEVMQYDIDF